MHVLESYISFEYDFFDFITHIRVEYDPCMRAAEQDKFSAVSMHGTLTDTLQEVCVDPFFSLLSN